MKVSFFFLVLCAGLVAFIAIDRYEALPVAYVPYVIEEPHGAGECRAWEVRGKNGESQVLPCPANWRGMRYEIMWVDPHHFQLAANESL